MISVGFACPLEVGCAFEWRIWLLDENRVRIRTRPGRTAREGRPKTTAIERCSLPRYASFSSRTNTPADSNIFGPILHGGLSGSMSPTAGFTTKRRSFKKCNGPLLACSIVMAQAILVLSAQAQTISDAGFNLPPEIVLDAREERYDVSGNTSADIYASIRERAPVEVRPFFARHQWGLEWEFRYGMSLGWCEIRHVELRLTSTTILPRWMPQPSPPANLLHSWDRFMRALRKHESGHQQHAVEAARAVRKALRDLRTTDCASISSEANSVAEKILESYVQKDQRYDVDTRHGRTQGAIWPSRD